MTFISATQALVSVPDRLGLPLHYDAGAAPTQPTAASSLLRSLAGEPQPTAASSLLRQLFAASASGEVHALLTRLLALLNPEAAVANDYLQLYACRERFAEVFRCGACVLFWI